MNCIHTGDFTDERETMRKRRTEGSGIEGYKQFKISNDDVSCETSGEQETACLMKIGT